MTLMDWRAILCQKGAPRTHKRTVNRSKKEAIRELFTLLSLYFVNIGELFCCSGKGA